MSEPRPLFTRPGYCGICERETTFAAWGEWLRDHYLCDGCGTLPRHRALVEVLKIVKPGWRALEIHESAPSLPFLAKLCPAYTTSFLLEGVPPGQVVGGRRCEDLERLTFADETFDVFITQDVLEHVFDPARALHEIVRVLRWGGVHVFTAPKHKELLKSQARARRVAGSVQHLLPAQYHGSPVGDGGSLVTWDYGADFDDLVKIWAGFNVSAYVIRDGARGLVGEYLDVFVISKDVANRVKRSVS